tara:strand:+ start:935 stop:1837 length:903 start_codon:yes stop_codon:yes gene_type:complete
MDYSNKTKSLSLVIPCNNEEHAIKISLKVYNDILKNLLENKLISLYEIIVVNNGSTDKTLEILIELKKKYKIKIVNLEKNFGYTSSYLAGMYHASNEMIITVSADLHEDPDKIQEMITKHYSTSKPVLGVYKKRHETFLKNFFSNEYYKFMKLINIPILNNHADFRLITKDINEKFFRKLPNFIFIRIRIFEFIDDYEKVFYTGSDRKIGKTKFNFVSSSLLAIDTILYYSKFNISKFTFGSSLFLFILFLITFLFVKIPIISIFFLLAFLLLTLFYFIIRIRIRNLNKSADYFRVKKII